MHHSSPEPHCLPLPSSSSSPSPTHECPVFADLSPLKAAERFTPQLFTPSHLDEHQQTLFRDHTLTSDSNVDGHCDNGVQIPTPWKENKSCTPSDPDPVDLDTINSTKLHSHSISEAVGSGTDIAGSYETSFGSPKLDETRGDQRTSEKAGEFTSKDLSNVVSVPEEKEGSYPKILNGNEYDVGNFDVGGHSSNPYVTHSNKLQDLICQPPSAFNNTAGISSRSLSNKDAMDTSQNQHGIRRRLQFENENDNRSIRRCHSYTSENPTYNFTNLKLSVSLFSGDGLQRGIYSSGQGVGHGKPITSNSHPRPEMVRSALNGVNSSKSALPISVSIGSNLKMSEQVSTYSNGLAASMSVANKFSAQMRGDENTAAVTSISVFSTNTMKPSNEQSQASCDESMSVVQNSSRLEELNKVSSTRNRKRVADISTNHCNCERSKCLKLYCECFASGTYCLDSCGCTNCFNKPEYEDTVDDARQQIVSRNPHAFSSKVVDHVILDSPRNTTDDRNWATPSSARRHKRGCNCKKSKCLKKYCECYQSEVGCSDGCRCENCQNAFGAKTETVYWRVEKCKGESHEKLNTGHTYTDSIKGMGAQFSSTWSGLDNTSNFVPLALPSVDTTRNSASYNLWNCSEDSQSQFGNSSQIDGSFHCQYPPNHFTPQLHGNEVLHDLSHDCSSNEDITRNDNVPYALTTPPTPIKAVKDNSPNKKQVVPPKFESQGRLGSISLQSLRTGGKFSLRGVHSFPSL